MSRGLHCHPHATLGIVTRLLVNRFVSLERKHKVQLIDIPVDLTSVK